MQTVHIRSLEKYHAGYTDRKLIWGKIYFNMVQGDPDCEMITNEIDWGRLVKFILLELQAQKPIPIDELYLTRKGFDLKQRPIALTLQALRQFIIIRNETVTKVLQGCNLDKSRIDVDVEVDKNRVEKNTDVATPPLSPKTPKTKETDPHLREVINHICESYQKKRNCKYPFNGGKDASILKTLISYYEHSGVKALWDVYLNSDDVFFKKAGWSIGVFKSAMPSLLDSGWKSIKQKYEVKSNFSTASEILKAVQ